MKKISVVTGARSEYGPLKILMEAIEKEKDLELLPVVTGMHLMERYGNTFKIAERDFPTSVKIPMPLDGDELLDMLNYLICGIKNLAKYFSENKPDIIIVAGDRSEALAASLAGFYLNILIAHINGGDVSGGTIDESIRHAITKISHIHLAYTKLNAERIRKMGEEKERIFVTGSLAIEALLNEKLKSKEEIFREYNLNPDEMTFLVVQHPLTTLKDRGYSQLKELFLALDYLKKQTILIYPNCDSGSEKLLELIKKYEKKEFLHAFRSLPYKDYVSFMNAVDIMIGNSSSGIIEAPTLKTPVINIGDRQQGREKSDNIIDVYADRNKILDTINFALTDEKFRNRIKNCKNKYGEGKASQKIVNILKNLKIDEKFIKKQITY